MAHDANALVDTSLTGRAGGSYQTVLFKPLTGILTQRKYIPLRFMPIALEQSLVDDPLDRIISNLRFYMGAPAAAPSAPLPSAIVWPVTEQEAADRWGGRRMASLGGARGRLPVGLP